MPELTPLPMFKDEARILIGTTLPRILPPWLCTASMMWSVPRPIVSRAARCMTKSANNPPAAGTNSKTYQGMDTEP